MARVAVEYQFTPIPSEALERLAAAGLTGREFRIILVVLRKTLGWSKLRDKIPMSQFARYTGIDRRKCHVVLTSLIKQKIIKKSVAANGDRKTITYSFNEVYAEWKVLPPMGTKAKIKVVPLEGGRLSPSAATVLSPSAAHSINKDRNLSTEMVEAPLGPFDKVQGPSLHNDEGMTCTHCGEKTETVLLKGEDLCIRCFKKTERQISECVSQLTGSIGGHLNA